jgi:DNA polymerase III subunit alpha
VKYIKRLDPASTLDLNALTFDDPAAYDILKKANTTAIFQVESEGMKKLLAKLEPDRFEDIIAVLALYRPGPLGSGMVDDFILRKKGKQAIDYFHPDLKACLSPTYGVIVYQEQVMQISQIIGGYTLGGADLLRRAMGKKKAEEMAKHREIFSKGAEEKGYGSELAMRLFDLMEKFAEYGFNKSHTAAYAVISYQTAWLKAHHKAAFMAATLSSDMDDTDSVRIFIEDSIKNGLKIAPPDINQSEYRFFPMDRDTIRYGLGAIKGTGEAAINTILAARDSEGPFKDLFDFCQRVDKRIVNRRAIEAMARAGAFDSLHDNRASVLNSVGIAMEWASNVQANAIQNSLFGGDMAEPELHLATTPAWSLKELLAQEKLALGYYFSGHPYSAYKDDLIGIVDRSLAQVAPQPRPQLMAGVVMEVRTQMTRRGKMAFVQLDDGSARLDVAIYNEQLEQYRSLLKEDNLLVVFGKVSHDDYSSGLRVSADEIYGLEQARNRFASRLWLRVDGQANAERLERVLTSYVAGPDEPGCPVRMAYRMPSQECEINLGASWRVRLEDGLMSELRAWLGAQNVSIQYG